MKDAGGTVVATAEICDRLEAVTTLPAPNIALIEYGAPKNFPADACPLCHSGAPITSFWRHPCARARTGHMPPL